MSGSVGWRLVLPVLLATVSVVRAATLSVSPVRVAPGRDFQVQVRLAQAASLYGCGFDLVFDSVLARARSRDDRGLKSFEVNQASILDEAGTTATFALSALGAESPGRLTVGLSRVGPVPGVSASSERLLVTIGMRSLAEGQVALHLERLVLQDASGSMVPVSTASSAVLEITTAAVNRPPRADAGRDRVVRPGRRFVLDATGAADPDGDALRYQWSLVSGDPIDLGDRSRPSIPLAAGPVGGSIFEVSVSDGVATSQATVVVTISSTSNTPPRVSAGLPGAGANGVSSVPFTLADAEGDPASVSVAYSIDGTSFRTATAALTAPSLERLATDPEGLPYIYIWSSGEDLGATHALAVWLRLTPRDATEGAAVTVGPFDFDDSAVTLGAVIASPATGSSFPEQDDVRFEGRAASPGGRALAGAELRWSSNLAGELGEGTSFVRRLPAGLHRVSLRATSGDRLAQSTSSSFTVSVASAAARQRIELPRGLNLIALPADPGTTAHPYLMRDLLRDTGVALAVRTGGSTERGFVPSIEGLVPVTYVLRGNEGYLVGRQSAGTLDLFARPWPAAQRTVTLKPGWQWLAVPGSGASLTSEDLTRLTSSPVVVETAVVDPLEGSKFRVYRSGTGIAPFSLRADRGYGVLVPSTRTIVLPAGGGP